MTSAIDPTKPTTGAALTQDVRDNFDAAKTEIEALQADLAADTGTGQIVRETLPTLIGALLAGLLDLTGSGGGQLKFPAMQNPSANANTLDDYEEGTWTPSVGGSATYTGRAGEYTKIGNLVTFTGFMSINAIGTGSASVMSGFPMAAAALGHDQYFQVIAFNALSQNIVSMSGRVQAGAATAVFDILTAAAAQVTTGANIFQNATSIGFAGAYRV